MTFMTVIAPIGHAPGVRMLSGIIYPKDCEGMFLSGLCAIASLTGAPATHVVSSGDVPEEYANAMLNPANINIVARKAALTPALRTNSIVTALTPATIATALSNCFFSNGKRTIIFEGASIEIDESAPAFITRMGFKPVQGTL